MWGVAADERHGDALAPGDLVLIYLGAPEIMFLDRPPIRISTIAHPRTLDRGIRFFAAILSCPATARSLVARNAAGRIVARIVVPNARFPLPATC